MKIIKIISHPFTVIITFAMILISGENMGGFYMLYLLLGLSHAALHSVFGVLGIIFVLTGRWLSSGKYFIIMSGIFLMFLSLYIFFYNDRERFNFETFHQTVPLISLSVFGIVSFCCIISVVRGLLLHKGKTIH